MWLANIIRIPAFCILMIWDRDEVIALQNEEQPNRVPNENKKKKELNNNE